MKETKRQGNWKEMSAGFNALENDQVAAYAVVIIRKDDPVPYYGFFAGDKLEDARKLHVKVDVIESFLRWIIERARFNQGKLATVAETKQALPWMEENMDPTWTDDQEKV